MDSWCNVDIVWKSVCLYYYNNIVTQQYNTCCATNIIGTPIQSFSLSWQYQSKSRTYSLRVEMMLASHNPHLVVRPSSNKDLAGNLGHSYLLSQKIKNHQNFHIGHSMP